MANTNTSGETAHLPAGFDDKKSRWYVEPHLREHYQPVPESVARSRFSSSSHEYEHTSGDAVQFARHTLEKSGELARLRKASRTDWGADDLTEYERLVHLAVVRIAKSMTREDEAWWLHYSIALMAAKTRYDQAQAWENGGRQAYEAARTCDLCGAFATGAARPMQLQVLGARPMACGSCRNLLPVILSDVVVDGRSRRERIAEWVAQHSG